MVVLASCGGSPSWTESYEEHLDEVWERSSIESQRDSCEVIGPLTDDEFRSLIENAGPESRANLDAIMIEHGFAPTEEDYDIADGIAIANARRNCDA